MELPSESQQCRGHGSNFTLPVTENSFGFQPVLLSQPHTLGCLLSAAKHQERMGAPGAACAAQKDWSWTRVAVLGEGVDAVKVR